MISESTIKPCISPRIEAAVRSWTQNIESLSRKFNVNHLDVEKQIRLHLPLLIDNVEDCNCFPPLLNEILTRRFSGYPDFYSDYLIKSGANNLLNIGTYIKNDEIYYEDRRLFNVTYSEVSIELGTLIESRLHYLRKARSDANARYGIFIEGYKYPICYMSFSSNIRNYQTIALQSALNDNSLSPDNITQLARVYGFGNLPRDSISKLISYSSKKLSSVKNYYIITAINPFIGFNGSSMIASGFKPFAYCQVSYKYDRNKEYNNRRHSVEYLENAKLNTPPNLLLVKGITKKSFMKVSSITSLINVPVELFNDINPITVHLSALRSKLEESWSVMTAYHGTPKSSKDPISKGQCGVTTAYLGKEFENKGYSVLFCEGDAYFPNGIKPIKNHCWLKIPYLKENFFEYHDIIIDLTSDQNGFNESIICDTDDRLKNREIFYDSKIEILPSTIDSENLIKRLIILKSSIESLKKDSEA